MKRNQDDALDIRLSFFASYIRIPARSSCRVVVICARAQAADDWRIARE